MSGPRAAVHLLGGFAVDVDGRPVDAAEWRRRQAAALVKVLALAPRGVLHREQVMDAIWPELDPAAAAPRLHKAAHFARRAMGASSVALRGDFVELFPEASLSVDALDFEAAAESALKSRDVAATSRAADLYPGELLPEDPYERWADQPRQHLHQLQVDLLRISGRWGDLVALEPTDEQAHLALARSLADAGDVRGALRQLDRLEAALSHELGVAPGAEAEQLRASLESQADDVTAGDEPAPASGVVGRDTECAQLTEVLPGSRSPMLRVACVSGPSGAGKTALLHWLDTAATSRDIAVGFGVAGLVEGEWPFAPVLEALADLCRRSPDLLDGLSPQLRSELDDALSGRSTSWDGQGAHQRLFVAAAELVRHAAAERGVVIVIDDAHLADETSVALVHHMARSLLDRPALLVLGSRQVGSGGLADFRESMQRRGRAVVVELGPLGRDAAAQVARETAPNLPPDVLEQIYQRAAGLPFGITELARAWAVDPRDDSRAAWIPPALAPAARQALAQTAVLGMTFDTDEMAAVSGLSDDEVYRVLDGGVEHRVLVRERPHYSFRHALIRESFLTQLDDRARVEAHRAAAAALEALGRSPARIGHHLVESGQVDAAVQPLLSAAETEAAHGAYREALAALDLIASVVEGDDLRRMATMRAELLNACGDLGAVDAYREALSVCDPEGRPRLLTRLARAATAAGDLDTAEQALAEVEIDGSENDAELLLARGNLAFQRQDYEAADTAAAAARDRIGLAGERWQLFDLVALQGLLAHMRGEWFQRLRTELRNSVERPEVAVGIFDSHLCVAEYLLYGPTPYDEVLALADQLRASASEAGVLRAVAFATALRGEAALLKGDLDLAESELLDAVELHHDLESPAGEAHCLQRLAEVNLARGDDAAAEQLLNRALPLARWSPIAPHLLQRIYGSLILSAPDADAAFAVVERSEATLAVEDDCMICTIMLDLPAAAASAAVGDVDRARAYIGRAEVSAERWEGTAWHAGVIEAKGHLAVAEGRPEEGRRMMLEAAALFEASGQPLDAERCRSAASEPAPAS